MAGISQEEFFKEGGFAPPSVVPEQMTETIIDAPGELIDATTAVSQGPTGEGDVSIEQTDVSVQVPVSATEFLQGGTFTVEQPGKPVSAEEKADFADRLEAENIKRQDILINTKERFNRGEISLPETIGTLFAQVGIGSLSDILKQGFKSISAGVSAITPDVIEEPLDVAVAGAADVASEAFDALIQTDIGKMGVEAFKAGGEMVAAFTQAHPREAEQLKNIGITALALTPTPIKAVPIRTTAVGRTGEALAERAVAQTARQKKDFVEDLIRPKQTAAVRKEQVGRTTEEGLLRTKVVAPSPEQARIAAEVDLIPDVDASKTLVGNFNAIKRANLAEAKTLKSLLKKNEVAIPKREFAAELERARERLLQNPTLVGDAAKSAVKVIDQMKRIVDKNPGTASGLLKSRKELDAWVKTQKPKVLDPQTESPLSLAVREVRQSTNAFIDAKATNVAVKDSLGKQSNLFTALENIAPKAADEATNVLTRAWQRVNDVVSNKASLTQALATVVGIGGLGAAAAFAPAIRDVLIVGGVTAGIGKAAFSPTAKKAMSVVLRGVDQAIKKTTNPKLLLDLKADRVAIMSLMEGEKDE